MYKANGSDAQYGLFILTLLGFEFVVEYKPGALNG
jgi:hypothetical protein